MKSLFRSLVSSPLVILLLITVVGGFFRFYNLDWDSGHSFHPDERNIAAAVSRIHLPDQLNPGFFAYGGYIFYLYRAAGEMLVLLTRDPSWVTSWGKINLVGRTFSAFFSTLSIPAIYLLARSLLSSKKTALLSSFFTAFMVSFIQSAHFGITENLLAFLVILLCFFSTKFAERPRILVSGAIGILFGIAVATKTSALSFFLMPLVAYLLACVRRPNKQQFVLTSLLFVDLLVISFLVFVFFSPYTLLSFGKFMESMRYEYGVATGTFSVPYTLQFVNTPAYIYQLQNLFWQMGPLVLFSLLGFLLLAIQVLKKRNAGLVVFLLFPIFYFAYVGSWHTKFIRFMFPILPFLIIMAANFFTFLSSRWKSAGRMLLFPVSILMLAWALAFFGIYTREQTRIVASGWIYRHIPFGSTILREHWDDGLPVSTALDSPTTHGYILEELTIYEPDNEEKLAYYSERLSRGDYLILNSRRLYGTLVNLSERYPLTSRYYRRLFAGRLGYEKVGEFSSYPSLFGVTINDDSSEETFQVYEHPKVMIFKNQGRLTQEELAHRLL